MVLPTFVNVALDLYVYGTLYKTNSRMHALVYSPLGMVKEYVEEMLIRV